MIYSAENINILWCNLIIEELVRNNINFFCISPGSRSTPLTIAVAQNAKAESKIFYDERASAYFATGYARATKKPAVIITTSGTAVSNLMPAITEASTDSVPIIILSADRPPELLDNCSNQTIDQIKIFGTYSKWFFNTPCPNEQIKLSWLLSTVNHAVFQSLSNPKGPVHLNCMFAEPLAPINEKISDLYLKEIENWNSKTEPLTNYFHPQLQTINSNILKVSNLINKSSNGLIIAGKIENKNDRNMALKLALKLNWPIFTDVMSGISTINKNNIRFNEMILFSNNTKKILNPDVVIHLGDRFVSKKLLNYLGKIKPKSYFHINENPKRNDPESIVTHRFYCNISLWCKNIIKNSNKANHDYKMISKIMFLIKSELDLYFSTNNNLSVPNICKIISSNIKNKSALFLANSMSVRQMDLFGDYFKYNVKIAGNRGASGIDGTIASAAGFAKGYNKPVTLMIGDLAFIHDLNSLHLLKNMTEPVIIVLINNKGGGIFSFLKIAEYKDIFEKYFETPHDLSMKGICKSFELNYYNPKHIDEFIKFYNNAQKIKSSCVIEVNNSKSDNFNTHKEIETRIKNMLDNYLINGDS